MGERIIPPPLTMRGGVLEPLEPVDRDNHMSLQAVIVKNGKIFIDSIDPLDDGANDENKRMEEEIDRLTGGDDDDFIDNSKFSQEAFDYFMRANDNEDDIMIYNQLKPDKEGNNRSNGQAEFQHDHRHHFEQYDFHPQHYHEGSDGSSFLPEVLDDFSGNHVTQQGKGNSGNDKGSNHVYLRHGSPVSILHDIRQLANYCYSGQEKDYPDPDGDHPKDTSRGGHRYRDSLNLEEYSTFDDDVDRLLSEDMDASWRYVPLYPEHYYGSGQEVQRVSVITDLPNLLRDNNAECMRRVVPKVREVLYVANMDMQLAAATAFLQILERKLVSVEEYKRTFLQTILTSVDNKNEEAANAWLETLLCCIDLLPKEVVKKDILSIAVNKGQLSQTLQARLSCCKILGKVSSKFESFVVKNDVLPVVLSLCGDVEYDVRACMCQRLDVVAHGLGLDLTKSKLLPQLIELSEDESPSVICACLETTANIISMLDREANEKAIIPMVKELLEKAIMKVDITLPVASRLFGRLCHSLLEYMTVEDKSYFQEYFKKLCKIGVSEKKHKEDTHRLMDGLDVFEPSPDASTDTRRYAAYNFPAMVLFVGPKLFRSELNTSFSQLCKDPHLIVRKTLAAGFHEVARLLGLNVGVLFTELNTLLNDADIEVLKAIIPNFQDIMSPLANQGFDQFTENRAHAVEEVVSNFLKAENVVFNCPCWRTQEALLRSMQTLHLLCSNDFIYNQAVPLLLDKLRYGRALPVKVTAAKTLSVLTRHLKYKAQRDDILNTIKEEFRESRSCYQRSLFIDLARCYLEVNSKQAFKENLYEVILNMKSDRVATVRLKLLSLFPEMKRSLKLPKDQSLRTALDTVLRQIIVYDKDHDVQQVAQQISDELTLIQEGSDSTRNNRRNLSAEEEEDLKREDEEKEMLLREEKDKREEESKLAKGSEKRNSVTGNKKDPLSKIPATKKSPASTGLGSMKSPQSTSKEISGKRGSIPSSNTTGIPNSKAIMCDEKHPNICLIKSKSTTCIPSLIPRLEHRPSTPPKKESVRRIPVLVTTKPALTTLSPSMSVNKKSSPTPVKKVTTNSSSPALSSPGVASTSRAPVNNVFARRGSMGSANSTLSDSSGKTKSTSSKLTSAPRTPKKPTK
ncbi:serine/threonine-protein phosphatase 4 regulatory subunit 4-like isoform X2 [Physella acuta]|uniref:serine/threonine-protein phosphatase 4 regulatory subunit 4-like isoform X2 n=1 Tax=Physella acuta TaxID=109671 RepID=UPI0027DEA652|nr:serine/threonine-protein phosphatase 4 regulatory subunit 4-like isoform X2 [Physella acuta]